MEICWDQSRSFVSVEKQAKSKTKGGVEIGSNDRVWCKVSIFHIKRAGIIFFIFQPQRRTTEEYFFLFFFYARWKDKSRRAIHKLTSVTVSPLHSTTAFCTCSHLLHLISDGQTLRLESCFETVQTEEICHFFSIRLQWTQTSCSKTSKSANGCASDIDEDCTDRRAKGQIQNEHHFKSRVLRDKFSQKIQSQSVSTQTHADGKLRGLRNFPTTSPSAGRWVDSRQIWFYFGWTCVFFTVALHNRKNPVTGQLWPHSATSFPGAFVADAVCNSYAESGRLLATNSKWICGPRSVHIGNQSAAKKKKKQKTLKCFLDSVTQI